MSALFDSYLDCLLSYASQHTALTVKELDLFEAFFAAALPAIYLVPLSLSLALERDSFFSHHFLLSPFLSLSLSPSFLRSFLSLRLPPSFLSALPFSPSLFL